MLLMLLYTRGDLEEERTSDTVLKALRIWRSESQTSGSVTLVKGNSVLPLLLVKQRLVLRI